MTTYYQKSIKVTQIVVNPENVRYKDTAQNQLEAMRKIIVDQGRKFVNLAKHIAQNGLEPGRAIYIHPIPHKRNFVVLDGNRRMTAIKVLLAKDLQTEFSDILPKNFGKISELFYATNKTVTVDCVVFPEEEEAREWIAVNHGYGADGVTTQEWDSDTKGKVMAAFNKGRREKTD
jgi:hypothetical protein